MTKYQFAPPLSDAEYANLRDDIAENGFHYPVIVDEHGEIIDGHHRARAATELGIDYPKDVREGLTEAEKRQISFSSNANRRSLTAAQKREYLKRSILEDPGLSNVQHGQRCSSTDKTAAKVRKLLEQNSEIPSFTPQRGRGRTRRKPPMQPSESGVDAGTGPAAATEPQSEPEREPKQESTEGETATEAPTEPIKAATESKSVAPDVDDDDNDVEEDPDESEDPASGRGPDDRVFKTAPAEAFGNSTRALDADLRHWRARVMDHTQRKIVADMLIFAANKIARGE